jgi:hypothetical protein
VPAQDRASDSTSDAERRDAQVESGPDRMPTPEEEDAAERNELSESVIEHEDEMLKRGARQKGEGRIS